MKIKTDDYVCTICRKRNVKLWRPYMGITPLICAECAEKLQSLREYEEIRWSIEDGELTGELTGKSIPLPKWKINEKGEIPLDTAPNPYGRTYMTDQLYISEKTFVPACPDEEGNFWNYHDVPKEECKWWKELPTR